jgi:hypothetical protein
MDALPALANRNEVTLMWVPGHCGILGNEKADELARQGAAKPLLGPEPALGIPKCSAREEIKNWSECQHSIPGIAYQVTNMVNSLLMDHARRKLMASLN